MMVNPGSAETFRPQANTAFENFKGLIYNIYPENWYKTFPFYFEINNAYTDPTDKVVYFRFYLPIPPESITIQSHIASEAHPTVGGVIEETSKNVFYSITMAGTTGMSSSASSMDSFEKDNVLSVKFRKFFGDLTGQKGPLSSAFKKIVNGVNNLSFLDVENQLPYQTDGSAVATPSNGANVNEFPGKSTKTTDTSTSKVETSKLGVFSTLIENKKGHIYQNGFAWTHALLQFFETYSKARSSGNNFSLQFVDIKGNRRWRCIPTVLQTSQTAASPYMIRYTIGLKCWDLVGYDTGLGDIKSINLASIDRLQGDLKEVYTTSVTGIITKIGITARKLLRPKSVASAFIRDSAGNI